MPAHKWLTKTTEIVEDIKSNPTEHSSALVMVKWLLLLFFYSLTLVFYFWWLRSHRLYFLHNTLSHGKREKLTSGSALQKCIIHAALLRKKQNKNKVDFLQL